MFDGMAGLLTHNGRRRCGHYGHFVMEQVEDGRSHQTPGSLRAVWNTYLNIRQSIQRFEASYFTVKLSDEVKLEVNNIGCKQSKLWREPPRAEAAPSAPCLYFRWRYLFRKPLQPGYYCMRSFLHLDLGQGERGKYLVCH